MRNETQWWCPYLRPYRPRNAQTQVMDDMPPSYSGLQHTGRLHRPAPTLPPVAFSSFSTMPRCSAWRSACRPPPSCHTTAASCNQSLPAKYASRTENERRGAAVPHIARKTSMCNGGGVALPPAPSSNEHTRRSEASSPSSNTEGACEREHASHMLRVLHCTSRL